MCRRIAEGGGPAGPGGLDILLALHGEDGRAHDAGEAGHVRDGHGQEQIEQIGSQRRHDGDGQQRGGDCQENVHDAHENIVNPAPVISGHGSDERASAQGDGDGNQPDKQGDAGAKEHAHEDVAPVLVCTEEVLQAGRQIAYLHGLLDGGLVIAENTDQDGQHRHCQKYDQSQHGQLVFPVPAPDFCQLAFLPALGALSGRHACIHCGLPP